MYNNCVELIKLLARPDGIATLDEPIVLDAPHRPNIHLHAAQVSPKGKIYAYLVWEGDQINLDNQGEWYELSMKHQFDRNVIQLLLQRLNELSIAIASTENLLTELNIEKEVAQ